jgi:hypothetical protein
VGRSAIVTALGDMTVGKRLQRSGLKFKFELRFSCECSPRVALAWRAGWSNMHRCLQIPEIVQQVCFHLAGASQHETLASLAKVCRIFRQPATEELWSRMEDGIEPLLDGMGDDLWDWEVDERASTLVMMDNVKSRV